MVFQKKKTWVQDIRPIKRRAPITKAHRRTMLRSKPSTRSLSRRVLKYVVFFLVIGLVGGTYFVLFWTSLFRITEPIVVGTERVSTEAVLSRIDPHIRGLRWLVVPKDALLAINPAAIEAAVLETAPAIKEVAVRKELPNILKVQVIERQPLAIWSAGGQFFFIDERGVAYDEIMRSESRDASIPVIVDEHNRATVEEDRVITEESLSFVSGIYDELQTLENVGINFFVAPSRLAPDLILVTSEGWRVFFDTGQDPTLQIKTLKEVLEQQVEDTAKLEYIDLRIKGRIFVK